MKKYDKFVRFDSDFKPIEDISIADKLPPGVYNLVTTPQGDIFFSSIKTNYDQLVNLPNTKYDDVVKDIETFLSPECEAKFKEKGFLYKNSILAYGPPGSGKTSIINRVTEKVVAKNGIVLFCPNPALLHESFKILESIQPGCLLMVIFEELDELLKRFESELLNILDGEIQKNNVIYMATTNYIDKIPARIRRPGRFSSVLEVGFPSKNARRYYLEQKLNPSDDLEMWVSETENFSIDELKEMVRSVYCLNKNFQDTLERIKDNKNLNQTKTSENSWSDWDEEKYPEEVKRTALSDVSKPQESTRKY